MEATTESDGTAPWQLHPDCWTPEIPAGSDWADGSASIAEMTTKTAIAPFVLLLIVLSTLVVCDQFGCHDRVSIPAVFCAEDHRFLGHRL